MKKSDIMQMGVHQAHITMNKNQGGPFGAVITDKEGVIIATASNTVLKDCDPTAHAEVNAIRQACKKLNTYDLSNCVLYATGYPCPMCLSAIIWANIKEVYFGCTPEDADKIGFRDDMIYDFLDNRTNSDISSNIVTLKPLEREMCLRLFEEYHNKNKTIY